MCAYADSSSSSGSPISTPGRGVGEIDAQLTAIEQTMENAPARSATPATAAVVVETDAGQRAIEQTMENAPARPATPATAAVVVETDAGQTLIPPTMDKTPATADAPKPYKATADKKSSKKTSKKRKSAGRSDENEVCPSCKYKYGDAEDPLIDDPWERCCQCRRWFHESCGSKKGRKRGFLCNICN
jgi:hypothetical protein